MMLIVVDLPLVMVSKPKPNTVCSEKSRRDSQKVT